MVELNGHTLRSSDGKSTPGKKNRSDWIRISLSSLMSVEVIESYQSTGVSCSPCLLNPIDVQGCLRVTTSMVPGLLQPPQSYGPPFPALPCPFHLVPFMMGCGGHNVAQAAA